MWAQKTVCACASEKLEGHAHAGINQLTSGARAANMAAA